MTTDLIKKEVAIEFIIDGKACKIGAMAKGSGMIHPNMATMLCFITTDVSITPQMLQKALTLSVEESFNMVSVDGDTSTNDMASIMASGLAGNPLIAAEGEDFSTFVAALDYVNHQLAKMIAADGEGATKLIIVEVKGAFDKESAKAISKSVATSNLCKTAMFGADANWGRVLCAIGYAPAKVDVTKVDLAFQSCVGKVEVCKKGAGIYFDEVMAKKILSEKEITVDIKLGDGEASAIAYGCDLTYDYVKINGDYRT
jgi:glutamate N-acetyltransferase/amino-acid N-acetyltransferase